MASKKLTDSACEKLAAKDGKKARYFDKLVPGLCLTVTPDNARTFYAVFRVAGAAPVTSEKSKTAKPYHPKVWMKLGRYLGAASDGTALTLAKARTEARAALAVAAQGKNPAELRKVAIGETIDAAVPEFVERFLVKGQKRNGTARAASYISGTKRLLEMHVVPRWRGRKITDITTAHVATLLNAVADAGKPIAARRVHAALNVFFGWCIGQGTITANPAKPATRPGRETRRDRVLAPDELATIWPCMAALDQRERKTKVTYPTIGPFGQLLLATGQRRNEVARMKWSHVDMDKALWTIPAAETKAKREHAVPLSALALEILKRCDRGGEFVFESTTPRSKGETARSISGFGPIKRRLDKLVSAARKAAKLPEIAAWELHDLRRSAASLMRAELGLSSDTIGRVLNHAAQGVTEQHYLRLDPLAEKRRALDAWGSYLTAIVAPKDDARKVAYIAGRGQATAAVAAG